MTGILWYAVGSSAGGGDDSPVDCEYILRHFNAQEATNKDLKIYQECNSKKEKEESLQNKDSEKIDLNVDLSHASELYVSVVITMIIIGLLIGLLDIFRQKNKLKHIFKYIFLLLFMGSSVFWSFVLACKLLIYMLNYIK
jgi:hypothetical protein